ncbi:AraC family transcriptional regulator [Actinomadura alba]|uniref:AraC family transcriptional regulator n=1 Tax=Actinomadura alba TaxID=406431 RepID=UPI0031CF0CDC
MSDRAVAIEDRGDWWAAASPPHPALRAHLRAYIGYWSASGPAGRVHTMPTRTTTLIINLGEPLRLLYMPDPGFGAGAFTSFVAGMHDGPGMYEHPGRQSGIQLDLTPLGAYTLLGLPMSELTNTAVGLSDLLGPATDRFVTRLKETPGWSDRFDLLDRMLLARLEAGPVPSPEVARAWRLLSANAGRMSVGELANEVGWSRKHLVNRFKQQVGLSPKVTARVLRFLRAVELMEHGAPSFVDIALACGYYDQAHLNREFLALAGRTPTELLAARRGSAG